LIADVEPAALAAWRSDAGREPPFVLDVREPWEVALCRIEDSVAVPLQALPHAIAKLPRDRDIVVVCHHGVRSLHAAQWLARAGFARVRNLRGGIAAWADAVEPSMARY
jgi:rhodanese-related sulfurtransferase